LQQVCFFRAVRFRSGAVIHWFNGEESRPRRSATAVLVISNWWWLPPWPMSASAGGDQLSASRNIATTLELCAAAAEPLPPTECRRRVGAVFMTCSRNVVHQLDMMLDLCNAVYNEALTLTKTVRTMRACFAIALDIQMKHGCVKEKVFSWTIL